MDAKTLAPPALIDQARAKLLEWHERAVGEQRRGTVAIEITYDGKGAVLVREIINLTTK